MGLKTQGNKQDCLFRPIVSCSCDWHCSEMARASINSWPSRSGILWSPCMAVSDLTNGANAARAGALLW